MVSGLTQASSVRAAPRSVAGPSGTATVSCPVNASAVPTSPGTLNGPFALSSPVSAAVACGTGCTATVYGLAPGPA